MNAIKILLAGLCLCTCVTRVLSQVVTPGPVAAAPTPAVPICVAHPEARSTGCAIRSDWHQAVNLEADVETYMICSVTNAHPSKHLHARFDLHNIVANEHSFFEFYIEPGSQAVHSMRIGPRHSGYCHATFTVLGPHDHADERQVRAAMTISDAKGRIYAISQLR